MKDSVLDQFRKSNLCFMDSLSSLSQAVSLPLSLSIYCFNSVSLTLSLLLSLLFQRCRAKSFFQPHWLQGRWYRSARPPLWFRLRYLKKLFDGLPLILVQQPFTLSRRPRLLMSLIPRLFIVQLVGGKFLFLGSKNPKRWIGDFGAQMMNAYPLSVSASPRK